MAQLAVEIEDLSVYYGNVCALSGVNMHITKNDFLGIIGPNGGGKSTFLKVILGLVRPTSGRITIFGENNLGCRSVLGYVPQFSTFDRSFPISVEDVVLTGRLACRRMFFHQYSGRDRKAAESAMKQMDVHNLRKRHISSLSGGQLQRVLMARALAEEPDILLLDEPTSSVDSASRLRIYDILRKLNEKMTIIVVTHDMSAISSYVKSLACLNTVLHHHGEPELEKETVEKVYGCPVDLIAHGVPHRVLDEHRKEDKKC